MTAITLAVVDGTHTTTSNQIAEHFGKRHADILRAIGKLECSPEFTERNFAASEFTDSTGRKLPAYRLTRDGFTFLCMGFTGRDAAAWKEKYIAAFNAMEADLSGRAKVGAGRTARRLAAPGKLYLLTHWQSGPHLSPLDPDAYLMLAHADGSRQLQRLGDVARRGFA